MSQHNKMGFEWLAIEVEPGSIRLLISYMQLEMKFQAARSLGKFGWKLGGCIWEWVVSLKPRNGHGWSHLRATIYTKIFYFPLLWNSSIVSSPYNSKLFYKVHFRYIVNIGPSFLCLKLEAFCRRLHAERPLFSWTNHTPSTRLVAFLPR